jgi:SpoVK/Ycf46/Vps4 family AAA+-type ATPase
MKKKNVINLIKYHTDKNEKEFISEAIEIARIFDAQGDLEIAEYIMSLLSDISAFVPQEYNIKSDYIRKLEVGNEPLPLPEPIFKDIKGIINAINHKIGMNKYLFEGDPGTGKTETVKQLARLLERQLLVVETSELVDSRLGQTPKNIVSVFAEINNIRYPEHYIVLFDEFDAIAMNRVDSNDLREMGRATSTILKELDRLNEKIVLIATTNLYSEFDKALTRRFDAVINFNRYTRDDLMKIAELILNSYLSKFDNAKRDVKLFRKIMELWDQIPFPGDLKNIIKTSLGFSNPNNEYDYFIRLFNHVKGDINNYSAAELSNLGFTVREIEALTGVSKSQVSRDIRGNDNE